MSRWNPFRDVDALHREIDRLLGGFGFGGPRFLRSAFLPGRAARNYPLLNVHEDNANVYVEALAPGLDSSTLEVTVVGDTITLAGEKKPLEGVRPEAYHRSERSTGKFVRTLRLDTEIADKGVSAAYERGILTVTLPKSERSKAKKIAVKVK